LLINSVPGSSAFQSTAAGPPRANREADGVFICYPAHPAWDRLVEVLRTAWRADRADINIGR
jgi:hypothetical protein